LNLYISKGFYAEATYYPGLIRHLDGSRESQRRTSQIEHHKEGLQEHITIDRHRTAGVGLDATIANCYREKGQFRYI
jgi:hypothetical protein